VTDERYLIMLDDAESSPEMLFLDLIENLEESYAADKIKVKSFLKDLNTQVESMQFSEFSALIMGHSDYVHIAQGNMTSIFEELQKKTKRKNEKEEQKKRKNSEVSTASSTKKQKLSENTKAIEIGDNT